MHFCRYHWLCPLKQFASKKIQEYLEHSVFRCFDNPKVVVRDNGSQFKAMELEAFLTEIGLRHVFTDLYFLHSTLCFQLR